VVGGLIKGYQYKAEETFAEILCERRSLRGLVFNIFRVARRSVDFLARPIQDSGGWSGQGLVGIGAGLG
jgi:hypothetical protein